MRGFVRSGAALKRCGADALVRARPPGRALPRISASVSSDEERIQGTRADPGVCPAESSTATLPSRTPLLLHRFRLLAALVNYQVGHGSTRIREEFDLCLNHLQEESGL